MKRAAVSFISLSFVDILFAALGAIIFLFIIVPKGGESADPQKVVPLSLDYNQSMVFGDFGETHPDLDIGDTIKALAVTKKAFPVVKDCPPKKDCPECPPPIECPPCDCPEVEEDEKETDPNNDFVQGLNFGFPVKFGVIAEWESIKDNVDLYLCKGGTCVYGRPRRQTDDQIGVWTNATKKEGFFKRIFGGERGNPSSSEIVFQEEKIISGQYDVLGKFKNTQTEGKMNVAVDFSIFSEKKSGGKSGKVITKTLTLGGGEERVASITLNSDGTFSVRK